MKHTIETIINLDINNKDELIVALTEVATRLFYIGIFFGVEQNKNCAEASKEYMDMYRTLMKKLEKYSKEK